MISFIRSSSSKGTLDAAGADVFFVSELAVYEEVKALDSEKSRERFG